VASNRQAGDADTMFLDMKVGELRRADFVAEVAPETAAAVVLAQIEKRRTRADRGLLPPEWSGGINGSLAAAHANGPLGAMPGSVSVGTTRGTTAVVSGPTSTGNGAQPIAGQPPTFENVTGNLPDPIGPVAMGGDGVIVGRIELKVEPAVPDQVDPDARTVRVRVSVFDPDGRPVHGQSKVRIEVEGATLAGAGVEASPLDDRSVEPDSQTIETRVPEAGTLLDVHDAWRLHPVADQVR
jgi:hypothetical protein